MTDDWWLSRTVISSEVEKSLLFAVRWAMFGKSKTGNLISQTFGHRPINICGVAATNLPSPSGKGDRVSGG